MSIFGWSLIWYNFGTETKTEEKMTTIAFICVCDISKELRREKNQNMICMIHYLSIHLFFYFFAFLKSLQTDE